MGRRNSDEPPIIDELIGILEKIKEEGIAVDKFRQLKNNSTEPRTIRLSDVADPKLLKKYKLDGTHILKTIRAKREKVKLKDEIDDDTIKKLGLDGLYPLGLRIELAVKKYNGTKKPGLTEEQKNKLEALGIVNKKTLIGELVQILKTIKNIGISIDNIQLSKRVHGERIPVILSDILSKEELEKNNLDGTYKIGHKISTARQAYKGLGNVPITEEEKRQLEDLGIVGELSKREQQQQVLIAKKQEALKLYDTALISWAKENPSETISRDDD